VALIGAVSQNAGVTRALAEAFNLRPEELLIPEQYAWCSAIGTAILEAEETRKRSILEIHRLRQHDSEVPVQDSKPLSTENVIQLRDRVGVYTPPPDGGPIPAYLGLDIGSVSTNVVAIDESGTVIHDVYLRTAGRPIEAVQQGLNEVERLWGDRLEIRGVGTTGSGRELIAEFVGADSSTTKSPRTKPAPSTSRAPWAASRWIPFSKSAARIRNSSRSNTAWWWISP